MVRPSRPINEGDLCTLSTWEYCLRVSNTVRYVRRPFLSDDRYMHHHAFHDVRTLSSVVLLNAILKILSKRACAGPIMTGTHMHDPNQHRNHSGTLPVKEVVRL